jgi:CBS domain-containing protein
MKPSQIVAESQLIELAGKSFQTFCDDISGMFGIDIQCNLQQITTETITGLQVYLNDLVAIFSVNAEGALIGNFQLVFDRQGLFILIGVIAMHPEQIILENANSGSLEQAQKENSILKEVGAAMVGSWDRVFRKGLDGHGRFLQTNTFIGNPWDSSEKNIGLAANEEVTFVPYELTVGSLPTFKSGVIFTKDFLADMSKPAAEQSASDEVQVREEVKEKAQAETESSIPNVSEGNAEDGKKTPEEIPEVTKSDESAAIAEQTKPADEETTAEQTKSEEDTKAATESEKSPAADEQTQPVEKETIAANESSAEQKPDGIEEPTTTAETDNKQDRPISEAIRKLTQSSAVSSDESSRSKMDEKPAINKDILFEICAKDIMHRDIIWANPEDSVQHALAKIQKNDTGYMMIGTGQKLEGIVSRSDLNGALSPYLRTIFAKWHRPLDDATLQIRIKWIMSKYVHIIGPDTPLTEIMEHMCQSGIRCLPVVDEQGKVQGLVTVFDIFNVFLNESSNE